VSGDYTRFTFDPQKDYLGVLKQQGRVGLDADWNEMVEIFDRRWRAETIDVLGHCIVPLTTPDAFKITPTAPGAFTIGIGRMYVDGLLAECHGGAPPVYDAGLAEQRGTAAIPYADQPYLPAPLPPALPATPGTTDLVYLDAWEREVTALEDPGLREIALGGPDTATRLQTAWQVRVLQNVGPHSCGDAFPAWDDLTAPSAGRLTTSAVAPPAADDPCILSPTGGYRGLENRLYRVEVHTGGPLGTARFKWSRDNASVAAGVEAIASTATESRVTVTRLGRDAVLRFQVNDWIEVLDDPAEFRPGGPAGAMARVTQIDEANRILTVAPALPASFNFNPADPKRHTRVRRWDQHQGVDAQGLLATGAGPIDLEDGSRVAFSADPAGGLFHAGDYWTFAARTADGSVELLNAAPPRGLRHHYCRLGFITWGADLTSTVFLDCREFWPPACCDTSCSVSVGDGVDSHGQFTDIQQAIDALGGRGGVVCIGRGFYLVRRTIRIAGQRNVTLRGSGPSTRILFAPEADAPQNFLEVTRTDHVTIEGLFVASLSAAALVRFATAQFCAVRDCTLVNLNVRGPNTPPDVPTGCAVELSEGCVDIRTHGSAMLAGKGIIAPAGRVAELGVRDNLVLALQLSIFLQRGEKIEIRDNRLGGASLETVLALRQGGPPTRATIDAFQAQVTQAFLAGITSDLGRFQAVGVLIQSGRDVVIAGNRIAAGIGILAFLLFEAAIEENQLLALIGITLLFGLLVQVNENLVLGLLVGLLQAGAAADLRCAANTWVGFYGILALSLAQALAALGPLLAIALGGGPGLIANALGAGQKIAGGLNAFGVAALLKIDRNLFLNFAGGLRKSDAVLSADLAVTGNSFLLCRQAGIDLGRDHGAPLHASQFLNPRHLVQGNAFDVRGKGITSAAGETMVAENSIVCPETAVELDAPRCLVLNNVLRGTGPAGRRPGGLVTLHNEASDLRVAGNRLLGGPGHGVLILEELARLAIEDNLIADLPLNGIATVSDAVLVHGLSVARNEFRACRGGDRDGLFWHSGALTIGGGEDARVTGNRFVANGPGGDRKERWDAVYFEDLAGGEFEDNLFAENALRPGLNPLAISMIALRSLRDQVVVQGNTARDNAGFALFVADQPGGSRVQRVLAQGNAFASVDPGAFGLVIVLQVESLQYQGNQTLHTGTKLPVPSVILIGQGAVIDGNTVETTGPAGLWTLAAEVVAAGNRVRAAGPAALLVFALARGIASANLATSLLTAGPVVRAANLPPP
jgi:hypothetical protein